MTFFFTKNTPVYSFGYLLESIYMQLKNTIQNLRLEQTHTQLYTSVE